MKYQAEIIHEILEQRGHGKSSLHYQSECIETWLEETKGAYPKLTDYQAEWLNYMIENNDVGEFPYVTLTDVTESTVDNVVPYAYKSATLKGSTKYRDIDTGDILDTFDETKNLELVSVKMPVLTTYTNLFTGFITKGFIGTDGVHYGVDSDINYLSDFIEITNNKLSFRLFTSQDKPLYIFGEFAFYDKNKALISCKYDSTDEVIETPNGTKYIRVWGVDRNNPTDNVKGMLIYSDEKPSNIATYKPQKTNILTVNEDVTLRSNGDICDELNLLTGQLTQRIGEDGVVLSQEVIKTVELSITDESGNKIGHFKPIEGTMRIQTNGEPIKPTVSMEIPVEATTQNLASFIDLE